MNAHEILTKARGLISEPENFCHGHLRDDSGAYCALGAIGMAANGTQYGYMEDEGLRAAKTLSHIAEDPIPFDPCNQREIPAFEEGGPLHNHLIRVAGYNNTHSHECVVAWFDRAIEETAK